MRASSRPRRSAWSRCCCPSSARSGSTTEPAAASPCWRTGVGRRLAGHAAVPSHAARSAATSAPGAGRRRPAAGDLAARLGASPATTSRRSTSPSGSPTTASTGQMSALQNAYNACLSVNILPTVLAQTTGLSGDHRVQGPAAAGVRAGAGADLPARAPRSCRAGSRWSPRSSRWRSRRSSPTCPTWCARRSRSSSWPSCCSRRPSRTAGPGSRTRVLVARLRRGRRPVALLDDLRAADGLVLVLVPARASGVPVGRPRLDEPAEPLVLLQPARRGCSSLASALAWAGPGHPHRRPRAGRSRRRPSPRSPARARRTGLVGRVVLASSPRDQTTPRERMDLFVNETMAYRDAKIAPRDLRHPPTRASRAAARRSARQSKAPLTARRPGRSTRSGSTRSRSTRRAARVRGCSCRCSCSLGLVWLFAAAQRRRPERLSGPPSRSVALSLTWGAMGGARPLIVLVPNLSVDYGVLRAFQQTLLVIAPVMATGLWIAAAPASRRPRAAPRGRRPVVLLLVLTGVLPALLGGHAAADRAGQLRHLLRPVLRLRLRDAGDGWLGVGRPRGPDQRADHRQPQRQRAAARAAATTARPSRTGSSRRCCRRTPTSSSTRRSSTRACRRSSTPVTCSPTATRLEVLDQRLDLVYSSPHARIYR